MEKSKSIFAFLLITSLIFCSCSTTIELPNGKQIDKRLVGVWQGSEKDYQLENVEKKWKMERSNNGTFLLNFEIIQEGESFESTETGTWWVEGNKFFEHHDDTNKTDTYSYSLLNKSQIKFELINTDIEFANPNYTFIDTKISKSKIDKSIKDGLSIETAMVVKSISEEYEFVKKNCQNCQVLGQALLSHKGKPYDELKLKKPNGEEISYYFDISSFYGKW